MMNRQDSSGQFGTVRKNGDCPTQTRINKGFGAYGTDGTVNLLESMGMKYPYMSGGYIYQYAVSLEKRPFNCPTVPKGRKPAWMLGFGGTVESVPHCPGRSFL